MENTNNTNTENTIQAVDTLAKVVKKYASENEQIENVMICKCFAEFKQIKDDEIVS